MKKTEAEAAIDMLKPIGEGGAESPLGEAPRALRGALRAHRGGGH